MPLYICKIKTVDEHKLWKGDLPFLPRVGDTIHFNHEYRVVKVVCHFSGMRSNEIPVTIFVEREEEKYFVITDNADMAFAFPTANEAEKYCMTLREQYNGDIHVFKAAKVNTHKAQEDEEDE